MILYSKTQDIKEQIRNPKIATSRCNLVSNFYDTYRYTDVFPLYLDINQDWYFIPNGPIILRKFQRRYNQWKLQHESGTSFHFLILEKNSNVPIGIVSIRGFLGYEDSSIGIGIHSNYRRQWYAEEVYESILQWAHEEWIQTLYHATHPDNTPSNNLAKKMGGTILDFVNSRWEKVYEIITNPCSPSNTLSEI